METSRFAPVPMPADGCRSSLKNGASCRTWTGNQFSDTVRFGRPAEGRAPSIRPNKPVYYQLGLFVSPVIRDRQPEARLLRPAILGSTARSCCSMAVSTCPSIGNCVVGPGCRQLDCGNLDGPVRDVGRIHALFPAKPVQSHRRRMCVPLRILTYRDGNPNAVPSIGGKK